MTDHELLPYSTLNIIGSWHIEGLNLNEDAISDMYALSQGHMTVEQAVNNVLARLSDNRPSELQTASSFGVNHE
ncbi:antitoxin VbhA family protein [Neisseria sp.]|uniref:antitoxin VbhA family protein n=1 Tax=Neisseria sp. TaxID=192066 RepID=UPI0026DC711D|nr:antitoxin VbhA family protein [Neisseria sp.]MDO4226206.1 antitoxin VbhA family protein [Neisseria sp.]